MAKFVPMFLILATLALSERPLAANEKTFNLKVMKAYRDARRAQVADLLSIWWAWLRPSRVGESYLEMGARISAIDTSSSDPHLQKFINRAERMTTEVAELFGQGGVGGSLVDLLRAGLTSSAEIQNERALAILRRLEELSVQERSIAMQLGIE